MRALRLSVAGAVILALLGGPGGMVLAQSETQDGDITWPQPARFLAYGDDPAQVFRLYELEPRAEPRPAVVLFHGGGLVYGEPFQDADWARWLAEQGYVTFMAGYRLFDPNTGENPWPAQLDDAQRAIRWVRAHADEFDVDPARVCAIGHSAGGQLAGLLGTTEVTDGADPDLADVSSRVDCVVSVSGVADMMVPGAGTLWSEVFTHMFGATASEDPDAWQAASPVHDVDKETVPFLVIHGNQDADVSIEMARNLAAALAEAGVEFVYAEVPADHFGVLDLGLTSGLQEAFLSSQLHPED